MNTWSFWLPILLLFATAFLAALLSLRRRDACLKRFNGNYVLVRLSRDRWVSGFLTVLPNSLEVRLREPHASELTGERCRAHFLFQNDIGEIECILRPAPGVGSPALAEWQREVDSIHNPSFVRRTRRRIRNFFNLTRDAFSQTLSALIGVISRTTRLKSVPTAEQRFNEVGTNVLGSIPNAFEQLLERHIGSRVQVESVVAGANRRDAGILDDYSAKFVLTRAVTPRDLPIPEGDLAPLELSHDQFDLIFPRTSAVVRYQLESSWSGGSRVDRSDRD